MCEGERERDRDIYSEREIYIGRERERERATCDGKGCGAPGVRSSVSHPKTAVKLYHFIRDFDLIGPGSGSGLLWLA